MKRDFICYGVRAFLLKCNHGHVNMLVNYEEPTASDASETEDVSRENG